MFVFQDTVISQAKQKDISVVFLLTNPLSSCQPVRGVRYDTCIQLYRKIAAETGGKVGRKFFCFSAIRCCRI